VTTFRACPGCGTRIIWAVTRAGKKQLLDYWPSDEGDIGVSRDVHGDWHARTLIPGDQLQPAEHRHLHHWASHPQCRPPSPAAKQAAAAVVTFLDEYRRGQAVHNAGKRRRKPRQAPTAGYRATPR
jgi:hypothetical protein